VNILSRERQAAVLRSLCEGVSIRATCRLTGVAKATVQKLLRDVGCHAKNYHDRMVRGLTSKRVQVDELWSFVGKKEARTSFADKAQGKGDAWTWYALDQDAKLIIAYKVGNRDAAAANAFMLDVADRLDLRVQLTSDGLALYLPAVEKAFKWSGVDYAMLVKIYGSPDAEGQKRYSPAECIGTQKTWVMGKPKIEDVNTSHIERMNLTTRMQQRRFTRLTNAFSKKIEYHLYAVALHVMWVNFCRSHVTLTKAHPHRYPTTPAMAAGLADHVWKIEEILALMDAPARAA